MGNARTSTFSHALRAGAAGVPLLAMLALLSACATSAAPPRTEPTAADTATEAQLRQALEADGRLAGRRVQVSVRDGVAYLSGYVQTRNDLLIVRGDATAIVGISAVDEQNVAIFRGGTPP